MNDDENDNVIPFPYGEIRNPIIEPRPDDEMDMAGECIQEILMTLSEYGYQPLVHLLVQLLN